jgi:hypothetical protein
MPPIVSKSFGVLYLQGLQAFIHLQKCLTLKVNFTPMPPFSISFPIFSYGRIVVCHDQEDYGPTCSTKSCIYNNNVC